MPKIILGCVALAMAAGCGSTTAGGSGSPGPTQFNLKITTAGNGVVRGAGADCRGSCTAQMASGAQVHLVAVADSGASFAGWAGACSGTAGCDLTLDADREVSATFAAGTPPPPPPPTQRRLTVIVQGKGRVTSAPGGLDCDSSQCAADFATGTSVTLTATAASGFNFTGWGTDCSGAGGCTLTLSKDSTVYANFVAQQPPPPPPEVHLVASTSGPGTVTGGGLNCGESSSTCDVKTTGGSSVTLTATPAGGARFTGWGGACSGTASTCQLTLQADTRVSAEFQSEVLALVPNDGTNGSVIALNSTQLFWGRYSSSGSSIWAIPKKGGTAVRVASGYPGAMVADDAYLYWTDASNLYSTPVGGGEVALLFSGTFVGKMALDENGALYFTVSNGSSGAVHRMQNRADAVLAGGQNPISIAVDAANVYYGDYSGGSGSIRRVPRNGGSVQTVFFSGSSWYPQAIRVDSDNVYFRATYNNGSSATSGDVLVLSKSDFKPRILSEANGNGGYQYPMEVEANASVVYWNWTGGSAPYGIFSAKADGSGFRAVDTSNDSSWYGLRVDDTALYYWHAGTIIRRLK